MISPAALELAGHLPDALGVVRDGAERVHRHDDAAGVSMPMPVSAMKYSRSARVSPR